MLNILAAVLLFGFIVLVHEFGHFLLAKCSGIGVVEFSVGMGPRIFSVEKGETRYSIKALPFGGSCMMVGEDAENPDPKAFNNKPVLSRIAVIAAGPLFNFILAFLFAMLIVAQIGHDAPVLTGVMEKSPAEEAGLQAGDRITRINGRHITAYRDIMLYTFSHPGQEMKVSFTRPAQEGTAGSDGATSGFVTLTPRFSVLTLRLVTRTSWITTSFHSLRQCGI